MPDRANFAMAYAALRQQYSAHVKNVLVDLVNAAAEAEVANPQPTLARLRRELHQLAGSGGSFGYPALSQKARALENRAEEWLQQKANPSPLEWAEWQAGLQALHQAISEDAETETT